MNAADTTATAPRLTYSYVVLGVLTFAYVFNYIDRQLVAILAQPIKTELGLSDAQLGLVSGLMFAIFYTTLGVPVGWLADRTNRVRILGVACVVWSVFTGLCGTANSFLQLCAARIGVGIGEAGGSPPSYSIISDYFPPDRRGTALGLFSLGIPFGVSAGAAIGSWIAAHFGWRFAFYFLGAGGMLASILIIAIVREPLRGRFDEAHHEAAGDAGFFTAIKLFFTSRKLLLITIAVSLSGFVSYGILSWTPAYLMRVRGMEFAEIGRYYSPVIGVAIAVGIFSSGYLADKLGAKGQHLCCLVPGIALLAALPFLLMALLVAPSWQVALPLIAVAQSLAMTHLPPAVTLIQNLVPASRRTMSSALLLMVLNISAIGAGPVYVGIMSDRAVASYGPESLTVGLLSLTPLLIVAVGLNVLASRALKAG